MQMLTASAALPSVSFFFLSPSYGMCVHAFRRKLFRSSFGLVLSAPSEFNSRAFPSLGVRLLLT